MVCAGAMLDQNLLEGRVRRQPVEDISIGVLLKRGTDVYLVSSIEVVEGCQGRAPLTFPT